MAAFLLDASIYVAALRRNDSEALATRRLPIASGELAAVWLSAVVLEELYAGIVKKSEMRLVERIYT